MSTRKSGNPKLLHRPLPAGWWLTKKNYFVFMMREFSAVFVGLAAVVTVLQVRALKAGPEAYADFQGWLSSPLAIAVAVVALGFALLHSITFFMLAGKVLVLRSGEFRVPPAAIIFGHFAAWAVASAAFAYIVL